jgi:SAM-dependent methyltransferase
VRIDYLSHHEELYQQRRRSGLYEGWEQEYARATASIGRVFENGRAPKSGRVVEIGCGAGNTTIWLAQQGFTAYGIDISPTAVDWARANAVAAGLSCEFTNGSVLDYGNYPSGFVDMVLDGNLVHCIIGEDRRRLFENVRRVLKPNGYFLVRSVLSPVDENLTERYRFDAASHVLFHGDVAYRYVPTFEMLTRELSDAGFGILGTELLYDLTAKRGFQMGVVEAVNAG